MESLKYLLNKFFLPMLSANDDRTFRDDMLMHFGPDIANHADVLSRLVSLSKTYSVPAEVL